MTILPRLIFLMSLIIVLTHPYTAEAHRFAPSLLKFTETSDHIFNVVWKTPTEATSRVPLQPTWPVSCVVKTENPALREGTGTVSSWTLDCETLGIEGLVGQKLGINGLAENQASAMVMLSLKDGRRYQSVVNAERPDFLVPTQPSRSKVTTEYTVLGTTHIWRGLDHLMFIFGLLLLVGGGARLLWTITAFTVGHSITLALVTLGYLTYPVSLIEFVIALSIFVLALELTRDTQARPGSNLSLFKRHPWWLAGGFGLLHGMGFAGALAEIGLPQANVPLALLFFNIGIEVGQIAFVFLVIGAWSLTTFALQRLVVTHRIAIEPERLLPIPVYLLGGISAMWCIERGLEVLI